MERFEDFADNLLALHGASASQLETFRLYADKEFHSAAVGRWVRRGIGRRPAVLDIHRFRRSCEQHPLVAHGSGPCRLTALHLDGLCLNSVFVAQLSSEHCPALADLRLKRCRPVFRELAPGTLRNLAIDDCISFSRDNVLDLAAPCPSSWQVHGWHPCYLGERDTVPCDSVGPCRGHGERLRP